MVRAPSVIALACRRRRRARRIPRAQATPRIVRLVRSRLKAPRSGMHNCAAGPSLHRRRAFFVRIVFRPLLLAGTDSARKGSAPPGEGVPAEALAADGDMASTTVPAA